MVFNCVVVVFNSFCIGFDLFFYVFLMVFLPNHLLMK